MPPTPYQIVTLVTQGGTPMQLADQNGAPFPTTGSGPLVFADGPTLNNPILNGAIFNTPFGFGDGSEGAPSIYFGTDTTTGIYSQGPGHIDFTVSAVRAGGWLTNGDFDVAHNIVNATWHGQLIGVAYGGTGIAGPNQGALDNITGWNSTGIISRVAASNYSFSTISQLLDALGSTRGDILFRGASGWTVLAPGTAGHGLITGGAGADPSWSPQGIGTVTSVGLSMPAEFTVSNSPVTTIGTLTAVWASETANKIFAAPNGAPGTPSFRLMVAADQPATTVNSVVNDTNVTGSIAAQVLTLGWTGTLAAGRLNANVVQAVTNDTNVTGSIAAQDLTLGWTGQLSVARGGTGVATATANQVFAGPTSAGPSAPGFRALVAADLPLFGAAAAGAVGASGGGTANFLRADGSWATPPGAVTASGPPTNGQIAQWTSGTNVQGISLVPLAHGGTNADLSATGGASQVLKQTSVGGAITVAQLAAADISGLVNQSVAAFTVQRLTGSGNYTPTDGAVVYIRVRMVGGGGGGAGDSTSGQTAGGNSSFGSWTTIGGAAGSNTNPGGTGGTGGVDGTGILIRRLPGGLGGPNKNTDTHANSEGGWGGPSMLGLGGQPQGVATNGSDGVGYGGGGAGASGDTLSYGGGTGGGGGEGVEFIVMNPGTIAYVVGAGGTKGTGSHVNGGAGAPGTIIVEEYRNYP